MGETAEFGEASIPINQAVSRWRCWVDRPDLARTKSRLKVDRPDLARTKSKLKVDRPDLARTRSRLRGDRPDLAGIKHMSRVDRSTSPRRATGKTTALVDPVNLVIVAFPARRL